MLHCKNQNLTLLIHLNIADCIKCEDELVHSEQFIIPFSLPCIGIQPIKQLHGIINTEEKQQ